MKSLAEKIENLTLPNENNDISFYEDYLVLSKEYETLIEAGLTKKREPLIVNRMDEIFTQMNGAIKNQMHEFGEEQFVKSSEVLNGI